MRNILVFLLLGICGYSYSQDLNLQIPSFNEGIVNNVDAVFIPDNAVADAMNVYFDKDTIAEKRKGMVALNTSALGGNGDNNIYSQFEFVKSNGVRYHIVQSSQTQYYRTTGNTFNVICGGKSKAYPTNYCVFMDTVQFANGVNNLYNWDTSRIGTTTSSYQPRYVISWSNRLWIAGDGDELSKVRSSAWLNPNNFTIPTSNALSTDPCVFDINSNDGQKVMGFFQSPNGNLGVLKEKSVWEIVGNDRDDYFIRCVNNDLGCINQGSVAYNEGTVYWLSTKGFVRYNGNSMDIISTPIQKTIDSIQQLNPGTYMYEKNSEAEWGNDSFERYVDYTTQTGYLKNINNFHTDFDRSSPVGIVTTAAGVNYLIFNGNDSTIQVYKINTDSSISYVSDFSNFSYLRGNHFATIDSTGKIYVIFYREDGAARSVRVGYADSPYTSWTIEEVDNNFDTYIYNDVYLAASIDVDSANTPHVVFIWNDIYNGSCYHHMSYTYKDGTWQMPLYASQYVDLWYDACMRIDSANHINIAVADSNSTRNREELYFVHTVSGAAASFKYATRDYHTKGIRFVGSNIAPYDTEKYVLTSYDRSTDTFGYYDPTISSSKLIISNDNEDVNGSIKFIGSTFYVSFNSKTGYQKIYRSGTFGITKNMYDNPTYYSDLAIMDTNHIIGVGGSTSLNDYLYAFVSSSTYVSEIYDVGLSGYGFDTFTSNQQANDYNIHHYIRGDNFSDKISTQTWTEMTSGSVITQTPKRYIQYKCSISTDIPSSNTSRIDRIAINYHSSANSTNLSSMVYDRRVWNAISKNVVTYLDHQLIFDKNGKWTDFTSTKHCRTLLNYGGTPFFGDDTGYIYTLDQSDSDNGDAIESYILTKQYSLSAPFNQKVLTALYIICSEMNDYDLNLNYYLDKKSIANESFTINLAETPNIINVVKKPRLSTPFYFIQFKIYNDEIDEPWKLIGLAGVVNIQPLR